MKERAVCKGNQQGTGFQGNWNCYNLSVIPCTMFILSISNVCIFSEPGAVILKRAVITREERESVLYIISKKDIFYVSTML